MPSYSKSDHTNAMQDTPCEISLVVVPPCTCNDFFERTLSTETWSWKIVFIHFVNNGKKDRMRSFAKE